MRSLKMANSTEWKHLRDALIRASVALENAELEYEEAQEALEEYEEQWNKQGEDDSE